MTSNDTKVGELSAELVLVSVKCQETNLGDVEQRFLFPVVFAFGGV